MSELESLSLIASLVSVVLTIMFILSLKRAFLNMASFQIGSLIIWGACLFLLIRKTLSYTSQI